MSNDVDPRLYFQVWYIRCATVTSNVYHTRNMYLCVTDEDKKKFLRKVTSYDRGEYNWSVACGIDVKFRRWVSHAQKTPVKNTQYYSIGPLHLRRYRFSWPRYIQSRMKGKGRCSGEIFRVYSNWCPINIRKGCGLRRRERTRSILYDKQIWVILRIFLCSSIFWQDFFLREINFWNSFILFLK